MLLVDVMNKLYMQVNKLLLLIWDNRKNPKLVIPSFCVLLTFLYFSGLVEVIISWVLYLLVIKFSILSGLAVVLCRGKHREPPAPLLTADQQNVNQLMEKLTKTYGKHYYQNHLVISKDLDKTIQGVIDLIIRDFCLSWFRDVGKDETAFVEILNKEIWTIIENLMDRLNEVDKINFLCNEIIFILYSHFHDLRLSDARQFPGQTTPFLLHPCLKDKMSEMKYLRTCSEALLVSLLPKSDSNCAIMKYMIREIVAGSVFLATAESICDPDYINQTLVLYLDDREKMTETRKQKYAYAETYEDFIKMINTTTDVETLKQIRYHTIAEIMQATVIHNSKDQQTQDDTKKKEKLSKKEALRERNLKRYINQCRVSKSQCEKRIRQLGGPDYRRYGLGHGQPIEESKDATLKPRKSIRRLKSTKVLSLTDILDNSLARSYLMMFLQRHGNENLLSFWIAVEKQMRLSKEEELHDNAAKIFQEFVTPSATHVIKFESSLVRGMEEFIYGKSGPEFFYEAEKVVYDTMESKFYAEFVVSHDYTQFVCQSEYALDQIRAHLGEEQNTLPAFVWSDGFNFKERRNAEMTKAGMPSHIEERNDYAVHSLQALDQNIHAKCQALELLKRSTASTEEQKELDKEIEQLNTERRQLEFHIERTDLWCEMLGHWIATISTAQYHPEDKQPVFLICVSCENVETFEALGTVPTGWVVARQLEDFKSLHNKLKQCCSWMSKELPVSSKKWYKKQGSENLEFLKESLQEYITIVLRDEDLCRSDEVYAFLIPSPEHLRGQSSKADAKEKKNILQNLSYLTKPFKSISKSSPNIKLEDMPMPFVDAVDAEEVEAGIEEESAQDRKDSIAETIYRLIGEVFELKGVFKILRKTLISFVQVTFGGTINRHLREFVSWLVSEPMMIYYIDSFQQSMWPKGKLAPYPPQRTDLEKLRTREQAKERMMKSIPDVLQNLVGKKNSKLGFMKIFEAIQDVRTNKHFFYIFLELIIITICPEIKSNEVIQSLQGKIGRKIAEEKLLSPTMLDDDVFDEQLYSRRDEFYRERDFAEGESQSSPRAKFEM